MEEESAAPGRSRKVKKLKRRRPRSLIDGPDSCSADIPAYSWAINGAAIQGQQSGQGDRYGLDAHPCLRDRDGGSRAAGAERISGRGKPDPEEPVEWAIEALRRRAAMLGKIGHRLGRQALAEVATVARPDTILAWYRKLVAGKFDGSRARRGPGRPRVTREVEQLIVRMASENRDWGYDRIVGALANLGYVISDQTVGNILHRHALPPAPERKRTTTWPAFIRTHLALLAGTDFFPAEMLTLRGLVTYYVLFFIHLESCRVDIAGITIHPDEAWMRQIARNATTEGCGTLRDCRYLLHDRDTKYTQSFRTIIVSGRVEPLVLPARSPNFRREQDCTMASCWSACETPRASAS